MEDTVIHFILCALLLVFVEEQCSGYIVCHQGHYYHRIQGPFGITISCQECPSGQYQDDYQHATTWCKACWAGTYQANTGQSKCDTCPGGTVSSWLATSCTSICPRDSYVTNDRTCELCPIPKRVSGYQPETVVIYDGSGSSGQCNVQCQPGRYYDRLSGICAFCLRGTYSDDGLQGDGACKTCAAGFYSNGRGSSVCRSCIKGTYSRPGSGQCSRCERGTYNSKRGAHACDSCPSGYTTVYDRTTSSNQCYQAVYIGCYRESYDHDVPAVHKYNKRDLTLDMCARHCQLYYLPYAALRDGIVCACVQVYGKQEGSETDGSYCLSECSGGGTKCGGDDTYAVYQLETLD